MNIPHSMNILKNALYRVHYTLRVLCYEHDLWGHFFVAALTMCLASHSYSSPWGVPILPHPRNFDNK